MNKKVFFLSFLVLFCISFEYAITRPSSVSLFINYFSANFFPIAWISIVPLNFLVIYGYNFFLSKIGILKTFFLTIFLASIINLLTCFFTKNFIFLQFMYKDIYILLMFKQIWSLIHSIDCKKSKYIYGLLFSSGGIGGIFGGIVSGFFAKFLGSNKLFLATPIIYVFLLYFYFLVYKSGDFNNLEVLKSKKRNYFSSFKNSKYLTFLLFLVVFMQISVTFVDYQFNIFLEKNILDVDLRTQYLGRLTSIGQILTTCMQIFSGVIFFKFLGLKKTHLFIPISLIFNNLLFLIRPCFLSISCLFVYIKSIDFSIFSISKELLFKPLSLEDKFRSKSIIDVFSYRTAKAFASIFLLAIQFYNFNFLIPYVLMIILAFWVISVRILFKQKLIKI